MKKKKVKKINKMETPYIKARNALVPLAEKVANELHGKKPRGKKAELWSLVFHGEMQRLVHGRRLFHDSHV